MTGLKLLQSHARQGLPDSDTPTRHGIGISVGSAPRSLSTENDDDDDTYSTPPTTPMVPSPSSVASSQTSEGVHENDTMKPPGPAANAPTPSAAGNNTNAPVRRLSRRPSQLQLQLDRSNSQEWVPGVELEAAGAAPSTSPIAGPDHRADTMAANGHANASPTATLTRPVAVSSQIGAAEQPHYSQDAQQQTTSASPAAHAYFVNKNGMQTNSPSDSSSTLLARPAGSAPAHASSSTSTTLTPRAAQSQLPAQQLPQQQQQQHAHTLRSPCFVHSFLEKSASLNDWLRTKQSDMMSIQRPLDVLSGSTGGPPFSRPSTGPGPSPQYAHAHSPLSPSSSSGHHQIHHRQYQHQQAPHDVLPLPHVPVSPGSSPSSDFDDEEDGGGSLTRQLAETAVGVREMSKQLGRARVRSNIQNVLIITKARDNRLIKLTRELALYLMQKPRYGGGRGLVVYVDNQLRTSKRFDAAGMERDYPELFVPFPRRRSSSSNSLASMSNGYASGVEYQVKEEGQLRYWTSDMCSRSPQLFDFVVTLGGDGTVLFTSWLFQRIVPPVLPFALGSLGFLTNFDFADHKQVMDSAIDNGIRVNLRMRFTCTVYRAVASEPGRNRRAVKKAETGEILMRNLEKGGWEALEGGWSDGAPPPALQKDGRCKKDKEIMCFTTRPVETFEILNDLVVDRGPSPYVSLLELFGDEHHMTTVQADGLTVATPTGSTAYSLSAGGSLVHPEIPALLITPICPHTLSFRPMLLPDSMELRICVPYNSRSTAWASFDGRGRVELKQGDHIKVTASKYPFPTVCADKQSTDWFHAISRTLKWNERERQKSFVVVEEGPAKPKKQRHEMPVAAAAAAAAGKVGQGQDAIVKSVGGKDAAEKEKAGDNGEEEDEEDEDEDEDEDEEEPEEEKFDIDDSSPEAAAGVGSSASTSTAPSSTDLVAMAKAHEEERARRTGGSAQREKREHDEALSAALALTGEPSFRMSGMGSTGGGGARGGIETPDRFAGAHPHPPRVSPRHVSFGLPSAPTPAHERSASGSSAYSWSDSAYSTAGEDENIGGGAGARVPAPLTAEHGARDHIHSPQLLSGARSRIPRDRDLDAEHAELANLKTPTLADHRRAVTVVAPSAPSPSPRVHAQEYPHAHRAGRGHTVSTPGGPPGALLSAPGEPRGTSAARARRSRSHDGTAPRAFAVWGQDESDSNASDSDV